MSSHIDDLVLDPFAGSGSAGEAAMCTARRFVGIELKEHYASAAAERIKRAAETVSTWESAMAEDRSWQRMRERILSGGLQALIESSE